MPFTSVKQEFYMRRNKSKLWREWVRKYGHHPDYKAAVKASAKKAGASRAKKKVRKGRGKVGRKK